MDNPKDYADVTFDDIEEVAHRLNSLVSSYSGLLEQLIARFFSKSEWREYILNLDGTGLSIKTLFENPNTISFLPPKSFKISRIFINFSIQLAGAIFLVCPKNKTTPSISEINSRRKFDLEDAVKKEEDAMRKINPGQKTIPNGYILLEKICLGKDAAFHWLEILGLLIDYYIAAIEPFMKNRIVAPTLGGINRNYIIEISMLMRGCFSLEDILIPPPITNLMREKQKSLSWSQKWTVGAEKMKTPYEMYAAIMHEHHRLCNEFMISLAELRREAIRRLKLVDEVVASPTGSRRTRMNATARRAMLEAMWRLSGKSNDSFTARDVHSLMRELAPEIMNNFDAAWLSGGKKDLLAEYQELKFMEKNSYRLTAESCTQLGLKLNFTKPKNRKKNPMKR